MNRLFYYKNPSDTKNIAYIRSYIGDNITYQLKNEGLLYLKSRGTAKHGNKISDKMLVLLKSRGVVYTDGGGVCANVSDGVYQLDKDIEKIAHWSQSGIINRYRLYAYLVTVCNSITFELLLGIDFINYVSNNLTYVNVNSLPLLHKKICEKGGARLVYILYGWVKNIIRKRGELKKNSLIAHSGDEAQIIFINLLDDYVYYYNIIKDDYQNKNKSKKKNKNRLTLIKQVLGGMKDKDELCIKIERLVLAELATNRKYKDIEIETLRKAVDLLRKCDNVSMASFDFIHLCLCITNVEQCASVKNLYDRISNRKFFKLSNALLVLGVLRNIFNRDKDKNFTELLKIMLKYIDTCDVRYKFRKIPNKKDFINNLARLKIDILKWARKLNAVDQKSLEQLTSGISFIIRSSRGVIH